MIVLALDGGGSGCRAVLSDASGAILGRGTGGPANVNSDREGALAAILTACRGALGDTDPSRVTAVLGLAGAEVSDAADWLAPRLPFAKARIVQDAVTATVGALGAQDGIVAALGTGSVFARQRGGAVTVIGGRGPILGDEAGGNWMGRRLLAGCLRAVDGLEAMTPLAQDTLDRLGGVAGVIGFAATARAPEFAALVPALLAAPDDPLAAAILYAADAEIAAYITRLSDGADLLVAFTGGLGPIFADRLAARFPVIAPQGTPLDGALRLALQDA